MVRDVLLVDEQEAEGTFLRERWGDQGVRVVQCFGLDDLTTFIDGGRPASWPAPPYDFEAAVLDLDLGSRSEGPVGGLLAIQMVRQWMLTAGRERSIVLRTQDFDDSRSFAAILGAELLGRPLPWWGKSSEDARRLLELIDASSTGHRARALDFGGTLIHPIRVSKYGGGVAHPLGAVLFEKKRWRVWPKIEVMDARAAAAYGGFEDSTDFYEQLNPLIAAINHLDKVEEPLHLRDGEDIILSDVEYEIMVKRSDDLETMLRMVRAGRVEAAQSRLRRIVAGLESDKAKVDEHLRNVDSRKPSSNQNREQGRFLGAYGDVLCHPRVNEIFGELYAAQAR